mgnify:FL=1
MTLAKINQKINFPGESRTKEQEYRKATPFFPVCKGALPIIIQALNYFIQIHFFMPLLSKVPHLN